MLFFNTNFRQLIEKEYIKPIIQEDNPTIHTIGVIGQLCIATSTNTVFVCKQIDKELEPIVYHWLALNSTAEDYNVFLDDIDELSETVELNHTNTIQAMGELHDLIEENVVSLQNFINSKYDNSIVKLDFEDKGTTKDLTITYGDDESEILYLNHTHPEYLIQHQDISGLATKSELIASYSQMAKADLSNVNSGYDFPISTTTYGGGESGKTRWRNGRLEQWGIATTSASGETEFTLHETFKDMKFSIFIEPRQAGDLVHYAYPSANNKFKARIQNTYGTFMACQFQWRAYGFWK